MRRARRGACGSTLSVKGASWGNLSWKTRLRSSCDRKLILPDSHCCRSLGFHYLRPCLGSWLIWGIFLRSGILLSLQLSSSVMSMNSCHELTMEEPFSPSEGSSEPYRFSRPEAELPPPMLPPSPMD